MSLNIDDILDSVVSDEEWDRANRDFQRNDGGKSLARFLAATAEIMRSRSPSVVLQPTRTPVIALEPCPVTVSRRIRTRSHWLVRVIDKLRTWLWATHSSHIYRRFPLHLKGLP